MTIETVEAGLDTGTLIARLWRPRFPSPDLVEAAAALLPEANIGPFVGGWTLTEGPRWEIVISPATVQVRTRDYARAERTAEREIERRRKNADAIATGGVPASSESRREVTGWSRRSRGRMVQRFCELDYLPMFADRTRVPAMMTLTYPGDWLTVAPNGQAVKAHLDLLRKRYQRMWGEVLLALWKLEFQLRGAPHFHLLMVPPHGQTKGGESFPQWLSRSWAEIVNHPDPEERAKHLRAGTGIDYAEGLRAEDPKRVAVYFSKHGLHQSKAYQNDVPAEWQRPGCGPGRFWGYWGLAPATAARLVDVEVGIAAARTIRRFARSQGLFQRRLVERIDQSTGRVYYRTSRFRVSRLANGRGWLSMNDGPAFASQLSRYLSTVVPIATLG